MSKIQLSDFSFVERLTVRWGDMDALGHVNNASFFTYDETVRLNYFSELMSGDDKFWKEYGLILAHIQCDFLAQLRAPAELQIGFRISKLGQKSLHTQAAMFHNERMVATTKAVLVWYDYLNNDSLIVPNGVRQKIRVSERIPPEESSLVL
ncbi:MAG: acyl-CoA thioesterase [Gammaproteobacteria bacterium]|nr:acyl-CoA thioesterase [Gammaproteobacteria bacterium]